MTSTVVSDSFFDSDGDQEKEESFSLKGEYNRGITPPSVISNSPQNYNKPDSGNRKASPHHSRSSTSGNYTAESDTMSQKRDSSGSYRSRSRSRSPSYTTRTRSRTPDYSDSFDSEDSMQDSRRASPVRNKKSTRRSSASTNSRYNSGASKDSRSTYRTYASSGYGRTTKPAAKKGAPKKKGAGRSQSVNTAQISPRSTEVSRRMLSAKGHTINKLRSEVDDLRRKYDDAMRENKLMKQLQRKQETALAKFEDKDEELPQLLRSHAAEVDNLRERLRRTQDREKDKDRRIKDKNEELNKLNDELKRLRHLADNKHLLDRDKLQRKLDRLQDNFDEKERRVNELERHVGNIKKNTKHDSEQWKRSEREYRARVAYLEEENQTMKYQLKEKEKELDIRNIYSNRGKLAKLNLDSTPRPLAQTRATSNDDIKSTKPTPTVKRSSSAEEKRKTDLTPRAPPKPEEDKKVTPRKEEKKKETPRKEEKELSDHEKILMDLDGGFKPLPPPKKENDDVLKNLDMEIKKRERLDEEKMRAEERAKRESEEHDRRRKAEEEERRRRREQEEEDRKRKEEEERKEREKKQKEEAPVKSSTFITGGVSSAPKTPVFDDPSSDEEDNIPFFGSKPKNTPPSKPRGAQPLPPTNSKPPSNSIAAVNSVRDLHRYSGHSRLNSGGSKPDSRESGDNNERKREEEELAAQRKKQKEESERLAEERSKKDLLLAKMKEIDSKPDSRGSKKEYKFTQPIENLHNGKPSHPDQLGSPNSSPKKKPEPDTFGGYAPSFGRRAAAGDKPPIKKGGLFDDDDDSDDFFSTPKPKPADKSKDLSSNLFADRKSSTPNKGRNSFEGTVFSTSTKAKPVADSATLPWEKKTQPGNFLGQPNKPNGVTVNMPKSTFDDFDDDIEEVIL